MFEFDVKREGNDVTVTLKGRLDSASAPGLYAEMEKLKGTSVDVITYQVADLEYISSAGLRVIIFTKQKLGEDTRVVMVGANETVHSVVDMTGLDSFVEMK